MELYPPAGGSDDGQFELCNEGNCDLTGIDCEVTGLPAELTATCTLPDVLTWDDECTTGTVEVTWTDPALLAGTYEATVTVTADGDVMDTFVLEVVVEAQYAVQFAAATLGIEVDPGESECSEITVENVGNEALGDIQFDAGALQGETYGGFLESAAIDFDPIGMSLASGESDVLEICAAVAEHRRADTYVGTVSLLANGDELFDELELSVTVNCIADMDIDNTQWGTGNVMVVQPVPNGPMVSREFELTNTGNCELTGIAVELPLVGLPEGVTATVSVEPTCPWDGTADGLVEVQWIDTEPPFAPEGTYPVAVTITADDGATDTFTMHIVITSLYSLVFVDEAVSVEGVAGRTLETLPFEILNDGNATITTGEVSIVPDDLEGTSGSMIPAANVEWHWVADPGDILVDETPEIFLRIDVPEGLIGQDYEGTLRLYHLGEWQADLDVTVMLEAESGDVRFYPNPCKASEGCEGVAIDMSGVEEDASVKIYDMFGVLVRDFGDDVPGVWDLENDDETAVASGMYIVTIETSDEVLTRKIMVIR
jgi:hypothetical protein